MASRRSRSSVQPLGSQPRGKANRKRKQRGLDAFSIASHQEPERTKIRQHRLGEAEDDEPRHKKQRLLDDEEDPDQPHSSETRRRQQKDVRKGEFDELDISGGSDSEGNEWRMGEVDQDEDSELDSDEAFGESDEEKFEGFAFRGSSSRKNLQRNKAKPASRRDGAADITLDEEESGDGMDADSKDEDDFGGEGVDLATMLDDDDASSSQLDEDALEDEHRMDGPDEEAVDGLNGSLIHGEVTANLQRSKNDFDDNDFGGFEDHDDENEEDTSFSGSESDDDSQQDQSSDSDISSDDDSPEKLRQLQDVVSSLPKPRTRARDDDDTVREASHHTPASLIAALNAMPDLDPALKGSVKKLQRAMDSANSNKPDGMVRVPLPKRQQDRLDREAAYEKAKETLDRWIDTVKHNRRAEHLSFPLVDPEAQEALGTSRLLPTGTLKAHNELESTIQSILKESGLGGKGANSKEEEIREDEELQANKIPLEEVAARRAELRKARELLFREEKRAKRIKKIKSKAYRRVHRRERAKAEQQERDLLAAAGVEMSEDEKEKNDRRRAEERMGARHRESRWARGVKESGRAVWDADARDAVTEMAQRNEELRKRMAGDTVRPDNGSGSEASDEDSDDEEDVDPQFRLREDLDRVANEDGADGAQSKLGSLKFMQRADAARKKQNDEDIERMRRELDGEESESEAEPQITTGRRLFGPFQHDEKASRQQSRKVQNEFEERAPSSDESENEDLEQNEHTQAKAPSVFAKDQQGKHSRTQPKAKQQLNSVAKARAFTSDKKSTPIHGANSGNHEASDSTSNENPDATAPSNTASWHTIQLPPGSADAEQGDDRAGSADASEVDDPLIPSNLELVRAAFAGNDDEASAFAAEKASLASSEDEQRGGDAATALPGWGSWAGPGIGRRDKKHAQLHRQRHEARARQAQAPLQRGVAPADRRDARLQHVIVSEKRSKKNAKYLAPTLPHPFENRQQYERSLRIPVGPEWTTKETFQAATKPRVMVKQGVIRPMEKPLV